MPSTRKWDGKCISVTSDVFQTASNIVFYQYIIWPLSLLSAYHHAYLEGLEDEQDTLKKMTNDDIESKTLASEEELMSEIETLQQKTVATFFTLQLSERDKLIELQQSLYLKGNWYLYIIGTSLYMILLPALDLAFIPNSQCLSTDHVLEKTQMKVCHMPEKASTQSSERDKLIIEDFQQSFPLKGN